MTPDKTINDWSVGDSANAEVSVTEAFVAEFAEFSGDHNPLHVDATFAETTGFKRRVAHGMSYGAIFSRLIGMELPGPGALWLSQSYRFAKPVFIGDKLRLSVTVTAINLSTNTMELTCRAKNQTGDEVMNGSSEVMLLEIENDEQEEPRDKQRIAIVTGGSRGIGAEIARTLDALGFCVAVTYQSSEVEAKTLADSLSRGTALKSDAADPTSATKLLSAVERLFGAPDTIILNAGSSAMYGDALSAQASSFQQQMDIQFHGPHALVSAALPQMIEDRFGAIVAISSSYASNVPPPGMAPYVVAKSALEAYIRCLAVDYGAKGIRLNIVAPSMTDTALLSSVPERNRKLAAAQNPRRRLAEPSDIASAAAYLVSEEAGFVNGHTLFVTGGSHM